MPLRYRDVLTLTNAYANMHTQQQAKAGSDNAPKFFLEISKNDISDILEKSAQLFKSDEAGAQILSWCLGWNGRKRNNKIAALRPNEHSGDVVGIEGVNAGAFGQQTELRAANEARAIAANLKELKNEIAHRLTMLNVPTHSKMWKRLSYTVDRPPADYKQASQLPAHLETLLSTHMRSLWEAISANPLPMQTPFPDTHKSFHITVESLHYLCSRHSNNLQDQGMLDQISLKLIVALKNLKECQQRWQISMGTAKQRKVLQQLQQNAQDNVENMELEFAN